MTLITHFEEPFSGPCCIVFGGSTPISTFAPVPEPETWALMLLGLGATMVVARRRRRTPTDVRGDAPLDLPQGARTCKDRTF
jgi:hypothetical protein